MGDNRRVLIYKRTPNIWMNTNLVGLRIVFLLLLILPSIPALPTTIPYNAFLKTSTPTRLPYRLPLHPMPPRHHQNDPQSRQRPCRHRSHHARPQPTLRRPPPPRPLRPQGPPRRLAAWPAGAGQSGGRPRIWMCAGAGVERGEGAAEDEAGAESVYGAGDEVGG